MTNKQIERELKEIVEDLENVAILLQDIANHLVVCIQENNKQCEMK